MMRNFLHALGVLAISLATWAEATAAENLSGTELVRGDRTYWNSVERSKAKILPNRAAVITFEEHTGGMLGVRLPRTAEGRPIRVKVKGKVIRGSAFVAVDRYGDRLVRVSEHQSRTGEEFEITLECVVPTDPKDPGVRFCAGLVAEKGSVVQIDYLVFNELDG